MLVTKTFSPHRWTGYFVNMLCWSLLYNVSFMKHFICKLADLVDTDYSKIKDSIAMQSSLELLSCL